MSRKFQFIAVIFGTLILLLGIEIGFWMRNNGAFPEINLYETDSELGVKLQNNAYQRLKLPEHKVSEIQTNEHGFRGENFPKITNNEIMIVGDAQAFGFGIEHAETFGEIVKSKTDRPVINLATPTYGPLEYNKLIERYKNRQPKHIIYALNLSDDLWEAGEHNTQRYSALNGWLHNGEGRTSTKNIILQKSHTIFSLRQLIASPPSRNPTSQNLP